MCGRRSTGGFLCGPPTDTSAHPVLQDRGWNWGEVRYLWLLSKGKSCWGMRGMCTWNSQGTLAAVSQVASGDG